jgi:hypothetical protein
MGSAIGHILTMERDEMADMMKWRIL